MPSREQAIRQVDRARAIRSGRAKLKQEFRDGITSPWIVLEGKSKLEPLIETMKVFDFLRSIPDVGEVTAYELMSTLGITPVIRFEGCTTELRESLSRLTQETLGLPTGGGV